jgi:hypothetical protein
MDHRPDIAGLEERLSREGVSVARLCRRADIAQSTWHRWKKGESIPRPKVWDHVQMVASGLMRPKSTEAA